MTSEPQTEVSAITPDALTAKLKAKLDASHVDITDLSGRSDSDISASVAFVYPA